MCCVFLRFRAVVCTQCVSVCLLSVCVYGVNVWRVRMLRECGFVCMRRHASTPPPPLLLPTLLLLCCVSTTTMTTNRCVVVATTLLTRSFTCSREVQRPSFALTHLRRQFSFVCVRVRRVVVVVARRICAIRIHRYMREAARSSQRTRGKLCVWWHRRGGVGLKMGGRTELVCDVHRHGRVLMYATCWQM